MNKNELINILEDWNFWGKELKTGIKRNLYLTDLRDKLSSEMVKVITGARRSGKSYIMRQLAEWLIDKKEVNKKNVLIINFEDSRFGRLNTELLQQIFDVYLEVNRPKGEICVFLDEIQEVPNWEKWVRTVQELNKANLVVSGSNSRLLSGELATVLTGRHLDTTVTPLSFSEFLLFKNFQIKSMSDLITREIELKALFNEFLKFGAFPLVALGTDKQDVLLSYYDDLVNKDLIKRYRIRKTEEIKSLAKFYLSNISRPVTFNSAGKFLNMHALSIEKFSSYLENSYALFFLKRFSFKVKEQEKSPRKVYAIDTGLAQTIGFQSSPNSGRLAENAVFLELKRRSYFNRFLEIYYWKSLAQEEVDFVVKTDAKVKELIQVCWDLSDIYTKKRETKALLKAMDEFKLKKGLIITEEHEGEEEIGAKKIQYVPLYKWLLGL